MDISTGIKQTKNVLRNWDLEEATVTRINQGLINRTFVVEQEDRGKGVLQQLHSAIDPQTNENLEKVTCHLKSRGMITPHLVRTTSGALFVDRKGAIWRMLTYVDGKAFDSLHTSEMAYSAGALLGTLHRQLGGYEGKFRVLSSAKVDYPNRLRMLGSTFERYRSSIHIKEAKEIYSNFQQYANRVVDFASGPTQLVHGDPKVSNILFENTGGGALCFVDLDTFAFMPVEADLGDAMRSWCNASLEDDPNACFNLDFFRSALEGYVANGEDVRTQKVVPLIVRSTIRIYLDLIARFLMDALEESYFGWDSTKYNSRGEHNLARARGQLSAMVSLHQQSEEAEQIALGFLP